MPRLQLDRAAALSLITLRPIGVNNIPTEFLADDDFITEALNANPNIIKHLDRVHKRNPKYALICMLADYELTRNIDRKLRDSLTFIIDALEKGCNYQILKYVYRGTILAYNPIIIKAYSTYPYLLSHPNIPILSLETYVSLIKINGLVYEYLSPFYKQHPIIIKESLIQNHLVYKLLSERYTADFNFNKRVLAINFRVYEVMSEEFKNNKHIIYEYIIANPSNIHNLPDHFKYRFNMMVSATGISNQGLDIFRHPTFNPRAIVLFKKNIIRHIKLYHAYISFTKNYLCSLNIRKIYCLHLANDFEHDSKRQRARCVSYSILDKLYSHGPYHAQKFKKLILEYIGKSITQKSYNVFKYIYKHPQFLL